MTDGLASAEGNMSHKSPSRCCRGSKLCKVPGCAADLHSLNKPYCLKKRLCPEHMKADAVKCEGCGEQLFRYCQQCGRLEVLSKFQGARRSCRLSLSRRRTHAADPDEQQPRGRLLHHAAITQEQQLLLQQLEEYIAGAGHSGSINSALDPWGFAFDAVAIKDASNDNKSYCQARALAQACTPGCTGTDGCSLQASATAPHSDIDMQEGYLDSLVQQEINNVLAAAAGTGASVARLDDEQQQLELEMMIEEELLAAAAMVHAGVAGDPVVLPALQHCPAVQFTHQPAVLPDQQQQQQLHALGYGMTAAVANNMVAAAAFAAPAARLEACNATAMAAATSAVQPMVHIDPPADSAARLTVRLQSMRAHIDQLQQMVAAVDAMQLQQQVLHRMRSDAYSACSAASAGAWQGY